MELDAREAVAILLDALAADDYVVDGDAEAGFGVGAGEQAGVARHEVELAPTLFLRLVTRPEGAGDDRFLKLLRLDVDATVEGTGEGVCDCRLAGARVCR